MRPYAPVDHDNLRFAASVEEQSATARAASDAYTWMWARHGDWGADEVSRPSKAAAVASGPCEGSSARLATADCAA
eukprot:3705818-Prymnesium_polylepis.2